MGAGNEREAWGLGGGGTRERRMRMRSHHRRNACTRTHTHTHTYTHTHTNTHKHTQTHTNTRARVSDLLLLLEEQLLFRPCALALPLRCCCGGLNLPSHQALLGKQHRHPLALRSRGSTLTPCQSKRRLGREEGQEWGQRIQKASVRFNIQRVKTTRANTCTHAHTRTRPHTHTHMRVVVARTAVHRR